MVKERIKLNNPERFSKPHIIPREKLEEAAKKACAKLKEFALTHSVYGFPGTCSSKYKYNLATNNNWETGMYTGTYLMAYQLTGDEFFKEVALAQLPTYRERIDKRINVSDHDVGFIYVPACVAMYKLFGDEEAKKIALDALDYYFGNAYSKEGKFIIRCGKRAWNSSSGCRTMMDSLMNASFFFWGGIETENPELTRAGIDHTKTTETYLIREDGSSFHHYMFDPETAGPVRGLTLQGNSDDSCWSRGHSWGVYGFPIAYSYAKEDFQREIHKDLTYYMLNKLPSDCVPYWDYDFTEGSDEPRDASAGVISACGMLEMVKHLPDDAEQKPIFESAAAQLLEAVIDNCTGDIGVDYDGLICHVTHAKPQGQGIDECAVYGDYFYLEALCRYLKPDEFVRFW